MGVGMRKFYMRLCMYKNTDVTYMYTSRGIEVTFESPIYGGFSNAVYLIDGTLLYSDGYTEEDILFFQKFVKNNRAIIERKVRM